MGSTEITKTSEYTSSYIAPITSEGIYKSNKPCDYTWVREPDLWFEKTPKPPQTWEEVKTLIIESKMNVEEDITTSLIDSSDLDFDNCTLPEVIGFLHKMSRDPPLAHLILPSRSISPML